MSEEQKEQKQGEQAQETPIRGVPEDLRGEIDTAVTETIAADKKEREENARKEADKPSKKAQKKSKDLPPAEVPAGDEADPSKGGEGKGEEKPPKGAPGEASPAEIPDALKERAVKAGMSLAKVGEIKDVATLEEVVGLLEKKSEPAGDKPPKSGDDKGQKADDPLAEIEALDPEVYDEKIIKIVDTLKRVVSAQSQEIASLKSSNAAAGETSWFNERVDSLGEEFVKALGSGDASKHTQEQKAMRDALAKKLAVLEAGYKAAGQQVDRKTAFDEAVAVVLGDVKMKAEAKVRADKLAERRTQHLSRPSGAFVKPTSDPDSDVAAQLDQRFFRGGKKG